MSHGVLQVAMWAGILLGGFVDVSSILLMTLRRPSEHKGRPSPVFAVPVVLYLLSAALAVSSGTAFPVWLVAGLVLVHALTVLVLPRVLARLDGQRLKQ